MASLLGFKSIAYLFISKRLNNFTANFFEKISAKFKYIFKTITFLAKNKEFLVFQTRYINILALK